MRLEDINNIAYKSQLVANWARYKKHLVIALGLNKYYSLLRGEVFSTYKY